MVVPQINNIGSKGAQLGEKILNCWRSSLNLKYGYFTLLFCRRRQRNGQKVKKTHAGQGVRGWGGVKWAGEPNFHKR